MLQLKSFFDDVFKSRTLLIFSLFAWAMFSFISNSALALHHVLIFMAFAAFLNERKFLRLSASSKTLLLLIFLGILSVLFNYRDLIQPLGKILKLKYFAVGIILYSLCNHYDTSLKVARNSLLRFFLGSFLIAVVFGFLRYWRVFPAPENYRPSGFFSMI